ncbi:MAG: hypothetical protein ACRET6_06815 [Burkholderiales bacterium]
MHTRYLLQCGAVALGFAVAAGAQAQSWPAKPVRYAEIVKAPKANDLRDFIIQEGGDPVGSSPAELDAYFKREVAKYAKIIKAGSISADCAGGT